MKYFTNLLAAMMLLGLFSTAHAASLNTTGDMYSVHQSDTDSGDGDDEKKKPEGEEEPDC